MIERMESRDKSYDMAKNDGDWPSDYMKSVRFPPRNKISSCILYYDHDAMYTEIKCNGGFFSWWFVIALALFYEYVTFCSLIRYSILPSLSA